MKLILSLLITHGAIEYTPSTSVTIDIESGGIIYINVKVNGVLYMEFELSIYHSNYPSHDTRHYIQYNA
jgi:hypothetical protein